MTIILDWISICVYIIIVLLLIIVSFGMQLNKPWILVLWSVLMILILIADGIITALALGQYQQQIARPSKQVTILFSIMIVRLVVSLCGIFLIIFHFRQLNRAKVDYMNRQRMLIRYNNESASSSNDNSWMNSVAPLNLSKFINDSHYMPNMQPPMSLPRAKVATVQRHPSSATFYERNSFNPPIDYIDQSQQQSINEHIEYNDIHQYNLPMDERFHEQTKSQYP